MLPQMIWGFSLFSASNVPYTQVSTEKNFNHAYNKRIGARDARQYLGPGEDKITITGTLVPFVTGGRLALQTFEIQAASGLAFPLIESNGTTHGFYVIESMTTSETHQIADGRPKVIEYTINFKREGDDNLDYSKIAVGMKGALGL